MKDKIICVVGLGYVGLPLAIEFGKHHDTIAYDVDDEKIKSYKNNIDPTGELSENKFLASAYVKFTSDESEISNADYIIIAVPTPVEDVSFPDFRYLIDASITVGHFMKEGCTVIYESTVYPEATEKVCIPILEENSMLEWKEDFNVGYSPERINPGDKEHTLTKIVKIVSGDTPETLKNIKNLYSSIIKAGVYEASSIKVAEAAKVIENIQRDVNIALMNEFSIIFDKLNIDTKEVLDAAKSKWNFLDFTPGLVGGHCIGVDPYYLTFKAEQVGYHPEMILAGRRINDGMPKYIVNNTLKTLIKNQCNMSLIKVGIFGLTFKPDCSDLRNSKSFDLIDEFTEYGFDIIVTDPYVNQEDFESTNFKANYKHLHQIKDKELDVLVIATDHSIFKETPSEFFISKLNSTGCLIDVKSIFDINVMRQKMGERYWRL